MTPEVGRGTRISLAKKYASPDDVRIRSSGYEKCLQCGRCTASCPAAYAFGDYAPRDIMRRLSLGEIGELARSEDIWKCGQCYSCHARCPRNNSAGLAILALREYALKHGIAPESIKRLASLIKNNLYDKGEILLPSTFAQNGRDKVGPRTYARYLENLDKRVKLGYCRDDARKVPIPEESMAEIRAIIDLTYAGE
ncbi:heterodisulfide reductase [Methanocella sp. CWC-04]|uniref:Heterodisulfide reductase n=1 Tax=Methanooceanicella nereidis TaxID=2052831 RepID=A0AAP2RBM6_9EURY|nr:4Fe-4S dicluster domain-containing protein [Methanocella sp. CWC-04]MCD1293931.1 heterodisulfide reductase [Methanocella sp. CWC-04]